jgi:hypothetical protein
MARCLPQTPIYRWFYSFHASFKLSVFDVPSARRQSPATWLNPKIEKLSAFVQWAQAHIAGDEKGQAQIFPGQPKPTFDNDRVAVTRQAADCLAECLAECFRRFRKHGVDQPTAQRFILQILVALFAEVRRTPKFGPWAKL